MHMQEIRAIARQNGIKPGRMTKAHLIRLIQRGEGNFDCFGSAQADCDQAACLWRGDCLNSTRRRL
jgi:hypothetical protein